MIQGVCCICSRGLVFSRTIEATDRNMHSVVGNWIREFTHDKPIPDAQNEIVEKARKHNPKWLWFVEEDIVPPRNALHDMLRFGNSYDVVATRYRLEGGTWCNVKVNGETQFTGLGCTLIKLSVFDEIGTPYFCSGNIYNDTLDQVGHDSSNYGQQDVFFFARLKELGIQFHLMNEVVPYHLRVEKYGDTRNNVGWHKIRAIA